MSTNPLDEFISVTEENTGLSSFDNYEFEAEEEEGGIFNETEEEEEEAEVEDAQEEEDEVVEAGETPDIPFEEFTNSWKSAGLLSENFKLPETKDIDSFKDAIFNDIYTPLKEAAEAKADEDYEELKQKKGLHVIEIAEKIASGVSVTTASDGEIIDRLVGLDIDSDTDEAFENREKLIRTMHQLKGIPAKKIDKLVQISQDDGEDIDDANEAKAYLKKLKSEKEAEEVDNAKRREDEYKAGVDTYNNLIKDLITKGEINEGAHKESFLKDLTEPSVYVDVNNGERNVKKKFTKFQKAQMDAGVIISPTVDAVNKKDVKKYLEMAHTLLYGTTTKEDIKKKVKKEVEDDLDNFLRKAKPSKKDTTDFYSVRVGS